MKDMSPMCGHSRLLKSQNVFPDSENTVEYLDMRMASPAPGGRRGGGNSLSLKPRFESRSVHADFQGGKPAREGYFGGSSAPCLLSFHNFYPTLIIISIYQHKLFTVM
jgi:hypothetical protein